MLGAACFVVWRGAGEWWVCDDALITFRYVDNLLAGDGFVYNVGRRVEGISNPAFAFLLAGFSSVGVDPFRAAPALGLVATGVEAGLVVAIAARATARIWVGAFAGVLFATDRIIAVWATGGLETSTFAMVSVALLALVLARRGAVDARLAGLLCAVAAALRPEGVVLLGFYVLATAGWRREQRPRVLRAVGWFAGPAALLLAARLVYFGDVVPNTFHAKVGGVPTVELSFVYLQGFATRLGCTSALGAAPWLAWFGLVGWSLRRREASTGEPEGQRSPRLRGPLASATLFFFIGLVTVAVMGGDYMNDFRFFRPWLGGLYVALALGVAVVADRLPRAPAVAAALGLALLAGHAVAQRGESPLAADAPPAREHKELLTVSRARAAHFRGAVLAFAEQGDSMLVDWAGFRGYGHTLRTIDATGLVSAQPREDFYLRPAVDDRTGARNRYPGHMRWPKVSFLEREGVTLIFPKRSDHGPERAEVTDGSPRRHRGYPFLHVVVTLPADVEGDGAYLRFFTTLDEAALRARAARRGVRVCWRPPFGELRCAAAPASSTL